MEAEADEEGLPLPANPWLSIWAVESRARHCGGGRDRRDHLGLVVGRKVAEVLLRDHRVPLVREERAGREVECAVMAGAFLARAARGVVVAGRHKYDELKPN